MIQQTDLTLIDGFFSQGKIPHQYMSEIPYPFITETMENLYLLKKIIKKMYFINLNYSNPAIIESEIISNINKSKEFNFAREGLMFAL